MVMTHQVNESQRRHMVSEAAYFLAEHRGFEGGDPVADWLQAEAQVDASLSDSRHVFDRLDDGLAAVNARLKSARRKMADTTVEAREEWQRDVERLAKLRDGLRKRLNHLRKQGRDLSGKPLRQLEQAWDEAAELLHRLDSRAKGGR